MIIFCSDNGPVLDDGYRDQAVEMLGNHKPSGPFRDGKYSVWEGGTRTPFITYWKGRIAPGLSDELVCTIDFASSLARMTGQSISEEAFLDSLDVSRALLGEPGAKGREHLLQQDNGSGSFGLREGDWKLVRLKKRGKSPAVVTKEEQPTPVNLHTLYNLSVDPGEQQDLSEVHPDILERLISKLDRLIQDGRSRSMIRP